MCGVGHTRQVVLYLHTAALGRSGAVGEGLVGVEMLMDWYVFYWYVSRVTRVD